MVVLATVFICAACGLVYELALVALGSYLVGNSLQQTAIVVSVVLSSMGLGALLAKPFTRWPIAGFATVELGLGLLGALSVPALYAGFAWLGWLMPGMVVASLVIGALIGAEIPLLMTLVQRIRAQEAGGAVADLTAADYGGALVGGLAFPFLLLPTLGLLQGVLVVGIVNVAAGWVTSGWLFGRGLSRTWRIGVSVASLAVIGLLAAGAAVADRFEVTARQRLYSDPIVHVDRSEYQEIVLTASPVAYSENTDVRLYLDGDLQLSSVDEYRYHEALVHPAMTGPRSRVLVLGGGDGMAVREVLRYDDVERVRLVDLDPAVVELARADPRLAALNEGSLDDPRVQVTTADAFTWIRRAEQRYDVVIVDLPDPDDTNLAKLYTQEFYGMVGRLLEPGGRMVVQAGSPFFAPEAFWCVEATVAAAGFDVAPYHVDVPSFGDWGFVLGRADAAVDALRVPGVVADELAFLDQQTLEASTVFSKDRRRVDVEVSTLLKPSILEYQLRGWRFY